MARPKANLSPRDPATTSTIGKDVQRQKHRGKDLEKFRTVIQTHWRAHQTLNLCDQPTGNWQAWRNCHSEPDRVLIDKIDQDELFLGRTGAHADLFE